jgi:hypothetical protein
MKTVIAIFLLTSAAVAQQLPHEDAVRIAEFYRLAAQIQDQIWPDWSKTPAAWTLVRASPLSAQSLLGLFGVRSQACLTRSRFSPPGENSAICRPLRVGNATLKTLALIKPRTVPLSMERKWPRIQFQPLK